MTARREYTVTAEDKTVRVMQLVLGGASPTTYDSLGLQVTTTSGHGVHLLPQQDHPFEKRVLVFFVPEISPGDSRSFSVEYTWANAWLPLKEKGEDWLTVIPHDFAVTDRFCLRLTYGDGQTASTVNQWCRAAPSKTLLSRSLTEHSAENGWTRTSSRARNTLCASPAGSGKGELRRLPS